MDPNTDPVLYELEMMLNELETYQLQVELFPAPEPKHATHMVRAPVSSNPPWYQKLCAEYPSYSTRKCGTRIKRQRIYRLLKEMVRTGEHPRAQYVSDLYEIAKERVRVREENEPF